MKPASVNQFCSLKYLSQITYSPSGKTAAFVLSEADQEKNTYHSYLYVKEGRDIRKLTAFGHERSFIYWGEDALLFAGNREEEKKPGDLSSRFYRIALHGGEAELAFTFPIPVSMLFPLSGDKWIAVGTTFPGWEDLYLGDQKRAEAFAKEQKENADYEVIEQVPWWWNGSTYTKGAYSSLFLYDSKKKKLQRLTDLNVNVSSVEVDAKRGFCWFMTSPVKSLLSLSGENSLCLWDAASGKVEEIAHSRPGFTLDGYLPADHFLLLLANDGKHGLNTDDDFYRMDYDSREITLYAKYGEAIGSSVGSDVRYGGGQCIRAEGDTITFVTTLNDSAYLYQLKDGKITPMMEQEGSVDCFDIRNGKVLAVALYNMKAQELYDEKGCQLTHFNDAALRNVYTAVPEPMRVTVGDHEIHGFVLKPMNYDPQKKYPAILDIHGGPKTVYGAVYYHEMQYWAGKGYFVMYCNPTGSDGRGAFSDIRGKYGTVDYDDLMAFCDAAQDAYPQIDRSNVFETGGSYGGFMTNWIIGHTDRFRACASQRSISDWLSFYGVSDIGVAFACDQNAATPWNDPEKLWNQSPMKYADKVKTPTLFIHSFEDYRCPIDQGYQMFTSLIAHGVDAKMVCFRGENHELSRSGKPQHRIKRLNEITEWFEKYKA